MIELALVAWVIISVLLLVLIVPKPLWRRRRSK
jgi:hypothetical protein